MLRSIIAALLVAVPVGALAGSNSGSSAVPFDTVFTKEVKASSNNRLTLQGTEPNGATAISTIINSPSYTTSGALLLSIRNNGTQKFYVDKDGNTGISGNLTISGTCTGCTSFTYTGTFSSPVTPTGGVDTANVLGTDSTFAATDILYEIQNNGTQEVRIYGDGDITTVGDISAVNLTLTGTCTGCFTYDGTLNSPVTNTGGTDIAHKLYGAATLTSTDKLLSVQLGTSEKAYIDGAGTFSSVNGVINSDTAATGGVDIAHTLKGAASLTSGDKLLSIQLGTTEKAYFDVAGTLNTVGNIEATGTAHSLAGTTSVDNARMLLQASDPATPGAGNARIYVKENGLSTPDRRLQFYIMWDDGSTQVLAEGPAS